MRVEDFAGATPPMVLEDFFAGRTKAWGIFQDRFGRLRQQFVVDIHGTWDKDVRTLTLTEDFTYRDGAREQRVWTIEKIDEHSYRGRAGDVVGTAEVRAFGSAVNLTYRMRIKVGGKDWILNFDDWMFRQDDRVMINRAEVAKWGIQLGTATIFFQRAPTTEQDAAPAAARSRS